MCRCNVKIEKNETFLFNIIFHLFQQIFEAHFRQFDPDAEFGYLKNFRRAKINFTSPDRAAYARIEMHRMEICGSQVNCYFAQVRTM